MLLLMLDPILKSLHLISFFVDQEEGINIVNKYDRRTVYFMFLKCYHHLHPMIESIGCVDQTIDEDCGLDIFQQIVSINEPMKKLVTMELLIFRHYQVDPKDIMCLLQWWGKHEAMFPTIGFLVGQILCIVWPQIEIDFFFPLSGHTYKLKEMPFVIKQLRKNDFYERKKLFK
jgi:hypothetical protein